MALVHLSVDVYCSRSDGEQSYRIYLDEEMLAERSWTMPSYEVFIRESVTVDVESGAHRLFVRECSGDPVFYIQNMTVNGGVNTSNTGIFFV